GPVSRLHRGGAQAQTRAGGRLSRDGGVARLFEVAPVVAGSERARGPERRGYGERARPAAQASGSHPRRGRAPVPARAARPRRVPARPARADRPYQAPAIYRDALRLALGLRATAAKNGTRACAPRQAHRLVTSRGARSARAADRPIIRL